MTFVYFLFEAAEPNRLLYIGRADGELRVRQSAFERRYGIKTVRGTSMRFSDFDDACRAELAAIKKHNPPFNRHLVSVTGFKGHQHSDAAKKAISEKNKLWVRTPEVNAKVSAATKGRPATIGFSGRKHTAETKAKLSGRHISEETRLRMSASAKNRKT